MSKKYIIFATDFKKNATKLQQIFNKNKLKITIMDTFKKIYELVIIYENGIKVNLLFRRKKDAIKRQSEKYAPGMNDIGNIIRKSYVTDRILF